MAPERFAEQERERAGEGSAAEPKRDDEEQAEEEREPDTDDSEHGAAVLDVAEAEVERLQGESSISLFGAEVSTRLLAAMAIFVAVFVLVWIGLWALLGGIGLGLGWLLAAAVALLAVRLFGGSGAPERA